MPFGGHFCLITSHILVLQEDFCETPILKYMLADIFVVNIKSDSTKQSVNIAESSLVFIYEDHLWRFVEFDLIGY